MLCPQTCKSLLRWHIRRYNSVAYPRGTSVLAESLTCYNLPHYTVSMSNSITIWDNSVLNLFDLKLRIIIQNGREALGDIFTGAVADSR